MAFTDMENDICKFFEIKEPGNIDELFFDFINKSSKIATPTKLIIRYKKEYTAEFRSILIKYIHLTLSYAFDSSCGNPNVILPFVCDINRSHGDCMNELGNMKEMTSIFMEILYLISSRVSKKLITDDIFNYYDGLIFITSFKCVKEELIKPIYWGLEFNNDRSKDRKSNKFTIGRNYIYNKSLLETLKEKGGYENFVEFLSRNMYFDPYYSYKSNALFPCFLDGFFEPFYYNNIDFCDEELGKMEEIEMERFDDLLKSSLKTITNSIHQTIFNLIRCNVSCRKNFLDYVRLIYLCNTEVKKMVYEKSSHITHGFAYNFCTVLDRFCDRIIIDNKYNSIDFFYINRVVKEVEHVKDHFRVMKKRIGTGLKNEHKISTTHVFENDKNEFMSTVFTYKVLFMDLSYISLLENMDYLARVLYHRDEGLSRSKDLFAFYQLLFSHEFAVDQMHFLNFIVENALRIEKVENSQNESTNGLCEEQEICKQIMENETIKEDDNIEILLDNQYYLPITKVMAKFFQRFDLEVPEKLYDLIGVIMASTMNINDKEILMGILARQPFKLKKGLFKSLFEIYIKTQKYEFFERISFRIHLNPIFYEDLNKNMACVKKEGKKFLLCVIKDLEKCLNDGLDAITTIKQLVLRMANYENDGSIQNLNRNEEYKNLKHSLKEKSNLARNMFITLEGIFKLILYMLEINIRLFQYEEIKFMLNNTLNYNLKLLVGPKCNSLSVSNMERYSFRPKEILGLLCSIYSHYQNEDLIKATVDSKDFNINIMKRAQQIIREKNIMGIIVLERFNKFVVNAEKAYERMIQETDSLQYPDEFLDPLTFEVMKDPVKLLTSNVVVDRSTFNLILASDGIDPFNRKEMDENSVVEEVDLKNKIIDFREKNKNWE